MADEEEMEVDKEGPRFVVKKWNAVTFWSWDICTDTCAICRNKLYEPSIEAQACLAAKPAEPANKHHGTECSRLLELERNGFDHGTERNDVEWRGATCMHTLQQAWSST